MSRNWNDGGPWGSSDSNVDLQRRLRHVAGCPANMVLDIVDNGNGIRISFRVRNQHITARIAYFRVYYLDATLVTIQQIQADTSAGNPKVPGFTDTTGKRQWVVDIPLTGPDQSVIVHSSPYSHGGWFYAVGVNVEGDEFDDISTAPALIPQAATKAAPPVNNVKNPQASFTNFKVGRTYYDKITIVYQAPNPLDTFSYVQIYIANYLNDGQVREGPVFQYVGGPGGQGTGQFVLECDDTNNIPSHAVTLYFVALSGTFAHKIPVTAQPFVQFPRGIINAMSGPVSPIPTAVLIGAGVQLTWSEINDQTIDHINIYRANQGTLITPVTNPKPGTPFATITKDQLNFGVNTWVDKDFNDYRGGNVQYSPVNPPADFSAVNPAQFQYWLTAVNDAFLESITPQTTGILSLRGNWGPDQHPGATYRDNFLNCIWNTQFRSNTTAIPISVIEGNQPRTAPTDAALSTYYKWTNKQIGTAATPQFVSNGTIQTGEVDIPVVTSHAVGPPPDTNRIENYAPSTIFLTGESIVLSVYAGMVGANAIAHNIFAFATSYVSGGSQNPTLATLAAAADVGGSVIKTSFPTSVLNVNVDSNPAGYQRFVAYGTLVTGLLGWDHVRFVIGLQTDGNGLAGTNGPLRLKQPMVNGGTEVAIWNATVRDQDAPGSQAGGPGGGTNGGGAGNGSGGQCPMIGTLIATEYEDIPVEFLKPGMRVLSPGRIENSIATIERVEWFYCDWIFGISTDHGTIWCSSDHPIASPSRFVRWRFRRAKWYRPIKHYVMMEKSGLIIPAQVKSVGAVEGCRVKCYAITLRGSRTYIANGFISHNKTYGRQT